MDKKALKKELWEKCISTEQENIDRLKNEIDEAQRLSNEYGAPKDRYDPYRTKLMRQRDLYAQQQAKAEQMLDVLKKVPMDKDFETVAFGALVITDKQKLFVSAAIGKVECNGECYYAISPLVPVYKAMEGKKAGDTFTVNNNKFTIKEIW
jgi:transcription elongation GreA/GreB family factor